MELRDYFSGFAVLASLVSLLISLRTARFNSRVKAVELKADLLRAAAAVIRRGETAMRDFAYCRKVATRPGFEKILAALTGEETVKGIVSRMRKFRDDKRSSIGIASVRDYEKYFSDIADADDRMEEIRADLSSLKTDMISVARRIDLQKKA